MSFHEVYSLHCDHIVHRDLALRNLLIDLTVFNVVVCDFGLSRVLDYNNNPSKTYTRTLPIAWSAPESLRDSTYSQVHPTSTIVNIAMCIEKTDVWAFGVLICNLNL